MDPQQGCKTFATFRILSLHLSSTLVFLERTSKTKLCDAAQLPTSREYPSTSYDFAESIASYRFGDVSLILHDPAKFSSLDFAWFSLV